MSQFVFECNKLMLGDVCLLRMRQDENDVTIHYSQHVPYDTNMKSIVVARWCWAYVLPNGRAAVFSISESPDLTRKLTQVLLYLLTDLGHPTLVQKDGFLLANSRVQQDRITLDMYKPPRADWESAVREEGRYQSTHVIETYHFNSTHKIENRLIPLSKEYYLFEKQRAVRKYLVELPESVREMICSYMVRKKNEWVV